MAYLRVHFNHNMKIKGSYLGQKDGYLVSRVDNAAYRREKVGFVKI